MLLNLEKVYSNINHSFHVNHLKVNYFPSLRHYHSEVEILLIINGTGTLYVGDSVRNFAPGDLVMIGPNVPHEWCSDKSVTTGLSEAIYILFNTEMLGNDFWNLPESKIILKIIRKSHRGIKLQGETRDKVAQLIRTIDTSYGFSRISILMTILELIAFSAEYHYLASPILQDVVEDRDTIRLNKVYKYVIDNMQENISLNKAASIANLSTSAFCRYFKQKTNKSFTQFLNEIRVGQASKILVNGNHSVADIGVICGFNNISYFIRQFKRITGLTPLEYRKKFTE